MPVRPDHPGGDGPDARRRRTERVRALARNAGFDICSVAPSAEVGGRSFRQWLDEGRHATMDWLARDPESRMRPDRLLPGCRSIILVGLNSFQDRPARRGVIARYALGGDYHDVIMPRLKSLRDTLADTLGGTHRPFNDTSTVMEKPHAARSALGWQGKNTMLIHRNLGNWLLLGGLLTTLDLAPDTPETDHCGRCTRCIDACPTGAITAPYQLDARLCIAYLTIEHKGSIPPGLRPAIGNRLFGCDDCLDICPWNRWARTTREAAFAPTRLPDLREMLGWSDADFRSHFRGTPVFRLKWNRWLRNVCVVLGNIGTPDDLDALASATRLGDPLIAEHAHWAIREIRARSQPDTTA